MKIKSFLKMTILSIIMTIGVFSTNTVIVNENTVNPELTGWINKVIKKSDFVGRLTDYNFANNRMYGAYTGNKSYIVNHSISYIKLEPD